MKDLHLPKIPYRFFKWYCRNDRYEELHGDLEELFYERVEEQGPSRAKWLYWIDVARCCQPYAWKKQRQNSNNIIMFKNYFKISLRGLLKSPLNSFINVFGLAVAIGICIFVYCFAHWTYSTDQFHEHKNEVFLATFMANRDGTFEQFGMAPRPLGMLLEEDFAQITHMCRVEDRGAIIKYGDQVFNETIRFTDPDFLQMFTFPLKWGTAHSLSDRNNIVLSEKMAEKYFGLQNPIGESIEVKFASGDSRVFEVSGVAAPFPKARTIDFDFLLNFENLQTVISGYNFDDWNAFMNATFIQVENPSDIHTIGQKMRKYQKVQNEAAEKDWAISSFVFEPLATLHERSGYIRNDISQSSSGNYASVVYLSVVALFMLLLACFNYINIAIVSATKRLKEIGLRKSIGASRKAVIVQFLSENLVITLFALLIGFVIGTLIIIPWFEQMWNFSMGFRIDDPALWLFMLGILLFTSLASGAYPSLYISKFQVVGILKGAVKFGKKNPLSKVLLTLQLVLACILITSAVMFTQNTSYLAARSWGYNQRETLYAEVSDFSAFEQLRNKMAQNPEVITVAGAEHHLGKNHTSTVLHLPDRDYEVDKLSVGSRYFKTMGLNLFEGRGFKDAEKADQQAIVVNEMLVENMNWPEPVGQQLRIDSIQYEVVGVVQNFHSYSFSVPLKPTIFTKSDEADYHYMTVRVREGAQMSTYKALQTEWATLFPEKPFQGGYQEDVWGNYYEQIAIHSKVWRSVAVIALSLVILGLYGLIKLNVAGRIKEFSIRKVLGAGIKNLAANITRQYLALIIVAMLAGAPLSYMLIKTIIENAYTYHMPISISGTVIAVLILMAVVLSTLSTQIVKVRKMNPVDGLKE